MKVNIKTVNSQVLEYKTKWAVWFDFYSSEDISFEAKEFKLIETWTVIQTPKWYMLQLQPRSSTFKNFGIMQVNSVWIIDQDYCWDEDTIKFPYINITEKKQFVPKWTRIWQWVFVKIEKAEFVIVDKMNWENRGWFGSTG